MATPALTVRELLGRSRHSFSFEFFPPRGDEGEAVLWRAVRELEPLRPTFVSVTYRAGAVRDRTTRVVERIARETSLTAVAHLTCAGSSTEELRSVVRGYTDAGVRNVLALRGDPPDGVNRPWRPHEEGLSHALDLVRLLHAEGDFCVGVAGFPEGHPESSDREADVERFVAKVAAGADFAVTQFFFHAGDYFDFVQRVRAAGCDVPVIPGVMPVTNVAQIEGLAALSGARFPPELAARLRAVEDDPTRCAPSACRSPATCAASSSTAALRGCTSTR